jgi:hypothetical protein
MNKKEFDEYCLSLGLVQTNSGDFWYGYNYPFKYARPRDLLVGFKISYKESLLNKNKLNETAQRTIKIANKIIIGTDSKCLACCGFGDAVCSDEEIKKKIYKIVKKYEEVIGQYKKYRVKSKVKEIEGDFV